MIINILNWYISIGLIVGVIFYLAGIIADIIKGPDNKFGYNCTNPIYLIMTATLMIPILNVFALLSNFHIFPTKNMKQKAKQKEEQKRSRKNARRLAGLD